MRTKDGSNPPHAPGTTARLKEDSPTPAGRLSSLLETRSPGILLKAAIRSWEIVPLVFMTHLQETNHARPSMWNDLAARRLQGLLRWVP
jgi:hypothetical protein